MERGHLITQLALPPLVEEYALAENWPALDKLMGQLVHSHLKPLLAHYASFNQLEYMLALRQGDDPAEEDGIWHDDGSRVLAFSWSLNFFGLPTGGTLGLRKKGQPGVELGPYPPGTLLIFQTGVANFEHRTARVTAGKRLVCAGWCS